MLRSSTPSTVRRRSAATPISSPVMSSISKLRIMMRFSAACDSVSNTRARRTFGMPGRVLAPAPVPVETSLPACEEPLPNRAVGADQVAQDRCAGGVHRSPPTPPSRQAKPVSNAAVVGVVTGSRPCCPLTRPPPRGNGETVHRAAGSAAAMLPAAASRATNPSRRFRGNAPPQSGPDGSWLRPRR